MGFIIHCFPLDTIKAAAEDDKQTLICIVDHEFTGNIT